MYFAIKTLIAALLIATVTQLAEKMPIGSALIKSLPLTSLLVFLIMKYEGQSNQEIMNMSWNILYMVVPSLILFVVFPVLLGKGWSFSWALLSSTAVMSVGYLVAFRIMGLG